MNTYVTILEMIGTIAFALAGTLKAIEVDLDLFGVIIAGVTTATGGGIFRDLILGKTPPSAFVNPVYVIAAAATSLCVFLFIYAYHNEIPVYGKPKQFFDRILLDADSLGLGIFTAMGVRTAWTMYPDGDMFLFVFCGVITGVGGGLLRDIMLNTLPSIFTKYVYASACMIGAIAEVLLIRKGMVFEGVWVGTMIVFLIRSIAARKRWSLPKVSKK